MIAMPKKKNIFLKFPNWKGIFNSSILFYWQQQMYKERIEQGTFQTHKEPLTWMLIFYWDTQA